MTLRQFFHNRDTSLLATIALIFVSLVWGASFYLTKEVLAEVSVIDFLGLRYGLGTLVTAVAMYPFYRRANKTVWIHGFTIGSIYAFGQVLQTEGMNYASASVSGFMVSLYVAGTPLVGWLMFRTRVAHITKVAVALSLAGAAVLGLRGLALGYGEAMLIGCAIVFSLHVVLTGRYATAKDALALAAIQLMVTGIWLALVAAPGGIGVPHTTKGWVSLVFLVIGSGVLALLAQTWAQSRLPAARAAVIMALEPVFASAVAVGFGDEQVTTRLLLGGALMIDLGGIVGRTVINHHDPLHPGNRQGRLHGCGDALSLVIGRDNHRHRQLTEIIRILNALVNHVGNSAVRQILAGGAAVSAWLLGVRVSLQLGKFLSDLLCRGEGHGASLKSLIYRFTWREMMPALARRSSAFRAASSAKAA